MRLSHKISNITPHAESYSEPSETSKMEIFKKIVNNWKFLTIFAKSSILGNDLGSKYIPDIIQNQLPGGVLEKKRS